MEVYSDHRKYFIGQKYEKHSLFASEHLQEMESEGLNFYPEISGYQRKAGVYLIDRWSNLADFERFEEHK